MALTSFDVKESAQAVGVSYGVMRKWRTEQAFKKMVQAHTAEFCGRFFEHIRKKVIASSAATDRLLKLPAAELAAQQIHRKSYEEFSDGWMYSDELMDALREILAKTLRDKTWARDNIELLIRVETLWTFDISKKSKAIQRNT
jgi:hypothetical protein